MIGWFKKKQQSHTQVTQTHLDSEFKNTQTGTWFNIFQMGLSQKRGCNKRTGWPHKSTSSNNQKKWLQWHRERRKDKGDGGGSIILKILFLCEELCVRKLCVCVCERVVCEKLWVRELCVKDCLWQSCVWKIVCVWQSSVWERSVHVQRDVCERLCVWDKVVCEWQSCVWQRCVWERSCMCKRVVCDKDCVWQSCVWQSCGWQSCVCDKAVDDKVVCERRCGWKSCVRQELCLTKLRAIKLHVQGEMWPRLPRVPRKVVCVWQGQLFERDGLAVQRGCAHKCHQPAGTQNAHARSSSSRRLCVRRLPTRAAAPPRGSVYCASTLSLTCVMSWCESHVWCEMCVMSVVRAKCCVMSWCESHVWCELVCDLSVVWWVGVWDVRG